VRIDKWLWAARFFKTRSLAAQAVSGGKVHVNDARIKPARLLRTGDRVSIQKGPWCFVVTVEVLSDRRGPAETARELYTESDASIEARRRLQDERRLASTPAPGRRPDKKARRQLRRLKGGGVSRRD
jgi:ribosome-associated heat shock protein Hsp15